jgi:hypothetical protein
MTSLSTADVQASQSAPQFREAAVLTRAVENVFRKLIRMLIGRISLKKLQEMIQVIFIEEAESKLRTNAPGENVALADLALLSGVDTRTIKKTKSHIAISKPIHKDEQFLDGFMPMFKIFDLWMNDERFFDKPSGKPKTLNVDGEGVSFVQLAKSAMQSRGMSSQLILKRLDEMGVISVDPIGKTVKLKQEDNIFISKHDLDSFEVGFAAIGNLADTVANNIRNNLSDDPIFYQRGCWDFKFNPNKIEQTRRKISEFLSTADAEARNLIGSLSDSDTQPDQITAGISMFYFEEQLQS